MGKNEDKRFEVIYQQGSALTTEKTMILRDKETGAEYLFVQSGSAGGLTSLIDKLGEPVVTRAED
mgnify:CR=1 FL=1